ncbi:energy transducer TonB [Prevotella sp.]|uniref:energy transducer TonB n=1 Tax=Prevotella sp. TaxID=59823 RepID=UPI002649B3AE|nr:hypothetical protein [Prevotella sp.]MDN5554173.1 hypothetical protein [Prevotella sp.]
MKKYIILLFMLIAYNQAFAQELFATQEVSIPDSIKIQELRSFSSDVNISKEDSCRTYNILHPEKTTFENGIYRYVLSGRDEPSRLLLCYKSRTYLFKNVGVKNSNDVISEYSDCIDKLKLKDVDAVRYLKAIWIYLKTERNMNKDTCGIEKRWEKVNMEKDSTVYNRVDQKPQFPEGKKALYSYLKTAIHKSKLLSRISRKVEFYVTFVIEYDGTVSNVELLSSFNNKYNHEIIKIVSHMPKWEPGKEDGKAIRFLYDLDYPYPYQSW